MLHLSFLNPSSDLLFHDGLLIGVKKIPLFSQWVVLQPRSGQRFQRRQRGTFLWGFLFPPLWAIVPLGLSLHSTCGVEGSGGRWSRHGSVGLLFCVPVKPRFLQQGARQVRRILETWPPFLLLAKRRQTNRTMDLLFVKLFEESHRKKGTDILSQSCQPGCTLGTPSSWAAHR